MAVIIDGTTGVATPGVTDTGDLSVAGTTTLTTPLPVASGGTGATSLSGLAVGNLAGGSAGTIPYQSTVGTTAMLATGTSGQVLTSGGPSAAPLWTTLTTATNITRTAKTSSYTLAAADKGNLIACTSGTFTLSFTAAATLGSGWCVYLQNSGTGEITLDPNGSETIDGLTSYIMYPYESRLVMCDGSSFYSLVITPFYLAYTTTSTFTKPPGYARFDGLLWGAGGGGAKSTAAFIAGGGGGGACVNFSLASSSFGATETVTIGAGGAAATAVGAAGQGGSSSIGSLVVSYGGGGGFGDSASHAKGGTGGGWLSAGLAGTTGGSGSLQGGSPCMMESGFTPTSGLIFIGFYGGGSFNASGSSFQNAGGVWGGGCGGGGGQTAAGPCVWGGGGGAGASASANANQGTSLYGGAGGAGNGTAAAGDGTAPGGGGGATRTGTAGAGARGEARIWGIT